MHTFKTALAAVAVLTAGSVTAAQAARSTVETKRDGRTYVSAPYTKVAVVPKQTKVSVKAPYTNVKVDTAAGHVRIRAPYYSGDIRW